jgi:hypothetical protein
MLAARPGHAGWDFWPGGGAGSRLMFTQKNERNAKLACSTACQGLDTHLRGSSYFVPNTGCETMFRRVTCSWNLGGRGAQPRARLDLARTPTPFAGSAPTFPEPPPEVEGVAQVPPPVHIISWPHVHVAHPAAQPAHGMTQQRGFAAARRAGHHKIEGRGLLEQEHIMLLETNRCACVCVTGNGCDAVAAGGREGKMAPTLGCTSACTRARRSSRGSKGGGCGGGNTP